MRIAFLSKVFPDFGWSCAGDFIRITNSSGHRRVCIANFVHYIFVILDQSEARHHSHFKLG